LPVFIAVTIIATSILPYSPIDGRNMPLPVFVTVRIIAASPTYSPSHDHNVPSVLFTSHWGLWP
jgi:hypothetical protein